MITTTRAAYLNLLEVAGAGDEYRVDQVLSAFEGDPGRIIGRGVDFEVKVPVIGQTEDETHEGTAALRVLQMPADKPEEVVVRVRVTWRSNFGDHISFMSCVLTAKAAEQLDVVGVRDAETAERLLQLLHLPRQKKDLVEAWLMTILGLAKQYSGKWMHDFPRMMDEATHDMVAEYHRRAVEQARADYPEMLGLLSPTYMDVGWLSPAVLISLCTWLQRPQPADDEESAA